jgi:hypothetical protein
MAGFSAEYSISFPLSVTARFTFSRMRSGVSVRAI